MTIYQLHKLIGQLIERGHKQIPVAIDIRSFPRHPLDEDGAIIIPVEEVGVQWIHNMDGDGGAKINKDGSESMRRYLVITGDDPLHREYWHGEGYEVRLDQHGQTSLVEIKPNPLTPPQGDSDE